MDKNEPAQAHTRGDESTNAEESRLPFGERTKRQAQKLESYAKENGIPTYWYPSDERIDHGGEHDVFNEGDGSRITKVTRKGGFGNVIANNKGETRPATPAEYLERINAQNEAFGDDTTFEATNRTRDGAFQIITSQSYLSGENPSRSEMNDFMESFGFSKKGHLWEHKDGTLVADAKPANFIKTEHGISPIDLIVSKKNP